MEAMGQSWTDDRLDDLSQRMDERFDKVEGEIKEGYKELRGEMAAVESRIRAEANENHVWIREEIFKLRDDSQQIHREMHALHRTIIQLGAGVLATLIAFLGLLITKL